MSDPRVIAILDHVKACKKAKWETESRPPLPHELKDLSGIDLSGAILSDTNLTGANLTGANLTGADLTFANLTGANLTGANLSGANLTVAALSGSNLILLTNATGTLSSDRLRPRPRLLLQPEEDGKLRIKITSLIY